MTRFTLALFSGLLFCGFLAAVDINSCQTINAVGEYRLTTSLTSNGATCFTISASNVTLDLNGFTLTSNKSFNTYGVIAAGGTNVTVKSGTIHNFSTGVIFSDTLNSTAFNLTLLNSTRGFEGFSANNTNVSFVNASYSPQHGLFFTDALNVTFQNNTVQDNGNQSVVYSGIHLENTNASLLTGNALLRNQNGITLNNSINDTVFGGFVFNSSLWGLVFSAARAGHLVSNTNVTGNYGNATYRDLRFSNNGTTTLHDASFNATSLSFDNGFSNLTVNWTVLVNVTNSTTVLSGAQVNLTSTGSTVANFSQSTNASGFTNQNVTEYFQNGSQVYGVNQTSFLPYNVTANVSGYQQNTSLASFTRNMTWNVTLFPVATLSSVAVGGITTTEAIVTASSDLSVNATVVFGPTQSYGSSFSNTTVSTALRVPLGGLTPGTLYHYNLLTCTASNACGYTSDGTFTTLATCTTCSGTPATPTPSPTPTPTPAPTPTVSGGNPTPVAIETPAPTTSAPASGSTSETTGELVNTQSVPVTEQQVRQEDPASAVSEIQTGSLVQVTHRVLVQPSAAQTGALESKVVVSFKNTAPVSIQNVYATQDYPFLPYLGPNPDDYPYRWQPRPVRIDHGSAVVTWLFDNIQPGQTVQAEFTYNGTVSKNDLTRLPTPRVIARTVLEATPAAAKASPPVLVPGGSDLTIPIVALALVGLVAAGYLFFLRKPAP